MRRALSILFPLLLLSCISVMAENFVPNSSFELGASRGWNPAENGGGSEYIGNISSPAGVIASGGFHGNFSLKIKTSQKQHHSAIYLTNAPGGAAKTYCFSFYAQFPSAPGSGPIWAGMMNGSELSDLPPTVGSVAGSWTRYYNTFSVTSNGFYYVKFVHIQFADLYVDAVQINTGTTPTTYEPQAAVEMGIIIPGTNSMFFTGDTPKVNLAFWNEHASLSVMGRLDIYDFLNSNNLSISTNVTVSAGLTVLPITFTNKKGHFRAVSRLNDYNKSYDEATFVVYPYASNFVSNATNDWYGGQSHGSLYHASREMLAGRKWSRLNSPNYRNTRWNWAPDTIEVNEGVFSFEDSLITNQAALGMNFIGHLGTIDEQTEGQDGQWPHFASFRNPDGTANLVKYSNYCYQVVFHFKNYIKYWELWNEPYQSGITGFGPFGGGDYVGATNLPLNVRVATNYAKLAAAGIDGITNADPTARIIFGAGAFGNGDWVKEAYDFLSANHKAWLYAVSTHVYPQDQGLDPNIPFYSESAFTRHWDWIKTFKPLGLQVWNTESGVNNSGSYRGLNGQNTFTYDIYSSLAGDAEAGRSERQNRPPDGTVKLLTEALRTIGYGFNKYIYYIARNWNENFFTQTQPYVTDYTQVDNPFAVGVAVASTMIRAGLGPVTNATMTLGLESYINTNAAGQAVVTVWTTGRTNWTLTLDNANYAVFDCMGNPVQTNVLAFKVTRFPQYLVSGTRTVAQMSNSIQSASAAVAVDTVGPQISIDIAPSGLWSGDTNRQLFKFTALDDVYMAFNNSTASTNVMYAWALNNQTFTTRSRSNHVWISNIPAGTNTFHVRAWDKLNNSNTISYVFYEAPPVGGGPGVYETWTIREPFGVSFPTQMWSLDYTGPAGDLDTAYLEGVRGTTTNLLRFQIISNSMSIAFRDNLPANGTNKYFLYQGSQTASAVQAVTVVTNTEFYQFTNGAGAGVRILRNGKPSATSYYAIQGFKLPNGVWTATNAQMLISGTELNEMGGHDFTMDQVPSGLITSLVESTVLESGPIRAQVRVVQALTRPGYFSSPFNTAVPGGAGYITNYITMKSGEKYWTHHVQTDWRWRTAMNYYTNAPFNEVRFLAHHTSSTNLGYGTNGPAHLIADKNQGGAASLARRPMGDWNVGWVATSTVSTNIFPLMDAFDYQSENNGPTATTLNTNSGSSMAVGVFTCNPAFAMGAVAAGPSIYRNITNNQGGIMVDVSIEQTIGLATNIAFAYGVITGTANDFMSTGVGAPSLTELARNKETFGTLDQITRAAGQTFPDPSVGWTNIFTTAADLAAITNIIRTVPATSNAWWNAMVFSPTESRSAIEIAGAGEARSHLFVTNEIKAALRTGLSNYVNGFGIYQADYATYEGMDDFVRYFVSCALVMAYSTNEVDKADLRSHIAWAAFWLNSQDFWPAANRSNGLYRAQFEQPIFSWFGLGLYNQFIQALSMGNMATLMCDSHPIYTNRISQIASLTTNLWDGLVRSDGWVSNEGIGYQKAATEPMMFVALMLQRRGYDVFQIPSWTNNLEYQIQMLTPFDPRFGLKYRLMPPSGDAAPQINGTPGLFSSGPRYAGQTALAARSLGAWTNSNSAQDDYFVPSPFVFHTNVTISPGGYRNYNFANAWNVWRSGALGSNELYLMFEHVKAGGHSLPSAGQISLYANGNPLVLPPGNTYNPELNSITTCSVLAPEASWTNWYGTGFESLQNSLVLSNQQYWYAFTNGGKSEIVMTNSNGSATRSVTTAFADQFYPLIVVRDTMRGNLSKSNMLAMFNIIGSNRVSTSFSGIVTPPYFPQMVSTAATVYYLGPAQHSLVVTSTAWASNFAGGSDVVAAINTTTSNQVLMRITGHEYIPNTEGVDFILANGTTFTERHTQLIVRGTNEIETLLLPTPKNAAPSLLSITNVAGVWTVQLAVLGVRTNRYELSRNYYSVTNNGQVCVASVNDSGITNSGVMISGGVAEVTLQGTTNLLISVHGTGTNRSITMPGTRFPPMKITPYSDGRPFTIRSG